MGTKEQTPTQNANTTVAVQQHQQQQQYAHLPKSSPAPQVIIVPATQASTVATNAAKKIRRAFSMPRNPFRWSRKFKTSTDNASSAGGSNSAISSCVGGGRGRAGSIVSLSSYEAICKDTNGNGNGKQEGGAGVGESVATGTNADTAEQLERRNGKPVSSGNSNSNSGGIGQSSRILRRSSFRKFLNRIAQHVTTSINVGANKHVVTAPSQAHSSLSTMDRVPPIGSYQWPADQTPGVMGLKNHGNTCFMNAVLQCLSHTDILAEYFVLDQYKADLKRRNKINSRKFGTKGELTEQLANVLKALWTCKNESDHSTSFKAVVDRYGTQFRSSTQQDAQEFLFWLLDKVHEDLNTATKRRYKSVKNTYGRPDEVIAAETLANHIRCNNSFVQAVFQAQFRSSLTCPRCRKQSNTFDPFHCISVQLPQLTQQTIFVTVVYLKRYPRQVKLGLTVPAGSPIVALREQLRTDTGIACDRMVLVDISKEGFTRVFYDTQPVATLNGIETIYCIEVPEMKTAPQSAVPNTAATATTAIPPPTSKVHETAAAASASVAGNCAKKTNPVTAAADLLLLVANVRKKKINTAEKEGGDDGSGSAESAEVLERFGSPFSVQVPRDCSYTELQKKLLREMSLLLKPEVFSYATPLSDMFQIRLQDPSADPDTYLQNVEHPLLTEMIDLALSVLSAEAGPAHIKLLLEWPEPEQHFVDLADTVVEDESVSRLQESKPSDTATLTLEQCLEHYTKAETLSAEDAWRCPHCQQYLPVVKTLGLWSLPDILVVHFKRFRQHQEKGANAAKLTTMVRFPLNAFDMSPHLARGVNDDSRGSLTASAMADINSQAYRPSPWKKTRSGDSRSSTLSSRDNKETRYDLYAVCYHQGDTLETGHYTAACKNPYDRQWYKFDDQRVSKVPNESIENEIINNEAYMLFYQRRTGDAAECSGSSSNSGDHWVSRIAPPPPPPLPQADKLCVANEKVEEQEIDARMDVVAVAATVEIIPEKIETKPVEIPKVKESIREEVVEDSTACSVVPQQETLTEAVVIRQTDEKDVVDIEELSFANDVGKENEDDELQVLEDLSRKEPPANDNDANQIFVMDEDCQINETQQIAHAAVNGRTAVEPKPEAATNTATSAAKPKSSPLLRSATTPAANTPTTGEETTIKAVLMNGFVTAERTKSPNGSTAVNDMGDMKIQTATSSKTSSSASSSNSSLSSRSSPHSLAVSVHGASTLQSKFNGFSTSAAASASVNGYKEVLLSSSLKSNSSSIISAAVAAHSNEFQLSRHQHQHWNGSHSSVSAVESGTQQAQQHAHCLNLRHSFSTSSNCKLRECSETLSMMRNSANTCSKDTLIFIDQQSHHHHHSLIEDDDDTFMGSRSLWISPVTPHKLITVSPKN